MHGRPPQQLQQVPETEDYITHNAMSVCQRSDLTTETAYVYNNNDDIVTLLVLSFHSFRSDRKLLVANSLPQNLLKLNK